MTACELFTASNISSSLRNLEGVEDRLDIYAYLRNSLMEIDVSKDVHYISNFRSFYVARGEQKTDKWGAVFFSILQREKRNTGLSFREVLQEMHKRTGRFEPSFSSKLVATVNPELPVWDKHVLDRLKMEQPIDHWKPHEVRISNRLELYCSILERTAELLQSDGFDKWKFTV